MIDEKYPSPRDHEESKFAGMVDERRPYSAQALEEQRTYEQRGIGLVEGTELLMKHTDGYALSQDEYDALYEDQAQHTKKLFEDLKRLQSRRQRIMGRGGGGSASSSSHTGKQRKARKRPPNVQVRSSATPSSASTRRTQTPVSKFNSHAKNGRSDSSRNLPKTPRSSAVDNDANTTRFRGAVDASTSTKATSREHEHQYQHQHSPSSLVQHSRPGAAHRESKVSSAATSSTSPYLEDPQYSSKRPNVAPLKPAHVNQRHGTQQSTEAAHGAQYKRHAHMLRSQQMSTDSHHDHDHHHHHHHVAGDAFQPSDTGSTGQATPRRRSGRGNRHGGGGVRRPSSRNGRGGRPRTADRRHATGSSARTTAGASGGPAAGGDGDEEEESSGSSGGGSGGGSMFPPDPLADDVEQHPSNQEEPRGDRYINHHNAKAGERSHGHARMSGADTSSAPPTGASQGAFSSATSSSTLSTATLRRDAQRKSKPKKPKPPSQKYPDPHAEARSSARGRVANDDNSAAPHVNAGKMRTGASHIGGADVKEITAILRTVQGSISELSTKMGECTEAIRSLTEDRRRVKQKDATADLHTGEIIQQSINALSRNVQECSRAVHGLASNVIVTAASNGNSAPEGSAAGSSGQQVARATTNAGAGDEPVAQGRQLLLHSPPPDAAFIMKKLTSMQEEIRAGMLKMQQHLTSRIDSTFADWLVEGTAAVETNSSSSSGSPAPAGAADSTQDRRMSSVQMLRQQTTQARQ